MKKIISIMLTAVIFALVFMPNVFASDDLPSERSFFISIYNDTDNTYIVENRKMTITSKTTVLHTLQLLKEEELISNYSLNDNELTSLEFEDKKIDSTSELAKAIFYTKLNGKKLAIDGVNRSIENGDIIEWIYGDVTDNIYIPQDTQEKEAVKVSANIQTIQWPQEAQNAIESGCEFLTLNQETSNFYIVALGSAGKSADVKMVNNLLSNVRQTQTYSSPTAIAKNILSLTFCGYDATELVSQLSRYEDIAKQGIFGPINALVAYDSKKYIISNEQLNSRDKLINMILSNQRETGGFSINSNSQDDLDTTAMAITALSSYIERDNVKAAIDKAVEFLLNNQTKTGGFGFMGQESCESLSQVIIALSSIGINVDDERFINNKRTLLDQLLEYRNDDGGFSHLKGEVSATMPTEQAVIALSSIKKNDNPYHFTKSIALVPKAKTQMVNATVKKYPLRTIFFIGATVIIVLIVLTISIVKTKSKNTKI